MRVAVIVMIVVMTMVMVIVAVIVVIVIVMILRVIMVIVIMSMVVGVAVDLGVVVVGIPGGILPLADGHLNPENRFHVAAGVVAVRNDEAKRPPLRFGERLSLPLIDEDSLFDRLAKGDAGGELSVKGVERHMVGFGERARLLDERFDPDSGAIDPGDQPADIIDLMFFWKTGEVVVTPLCFLLYGSLHRDERFSLASHGSS